MKYHVCPGVVIVDVCDEHLMIATGEARGKVPYVKKINATGVFFWRLFERGLDGEGIVAAAVAEYGISRDEALAAYRSFSASLASFTHNPVANTETSFPSFNTIPLPISNW